MNTPIYDFVSDYIRAGRSRLHMPGHKGQSAFGAALYGIEARDITEIHGADVLSEATGIIGESEANAAALFGTALTLYSTEGSSLALRTMLALALSRAPRIPGERPLLLAARNAHKSLLYAAALLAWIYPEDTALDSICSCHPSPNSVRAALRALPRPPFAVFLTSPDYLGFLADIQGIVTAVDACCGAGSVPVLVDNAHGAYLHFLETPMHPMDQGAYLCCDSAHKTLPVLTGGAYLHFSAEAAAEVGASARRTMELFASTSPSYLILQSLDLCNAYLADNYPARLYACIRRIEGLGYYLRTLGAKLCESEPLKLVLGSGALSGAEVATLFRSHQMEVEFADLSAVVLMLTPENRPEDFLRIASLYREEAALWTKKETAKEPSLRLLPLPRILTIREAMLSPQETVPVTEAVGRILGQPTVSCPPAVPLAVSGERLSAELLPLFLRYGVTEVAVVRE